MTTSAQAPIHSLYGASAEDYIAEVVSYVPFPEERQRIEMELRLRLEPGVTIEQATARYGQPRELAEFYLASVPLESAPFFRRVIAALIDIPSVLGAGALFFYYAWKVAGLGPLSLQGALRNPIAMGLGIVTLALMSPMYYVVAETWTSQTVGKALMGLRTVRESGAKISVGQAIVRQIPLLCSFYAIDAVVALFTEKKQRMFEILSRTRVVRAR